MACDPPLRATNACLHAAWSGSSCIKAEADIDPRLVDGATQPEADIDGWRVGA